MKLLAVLLMFLTGETLATNSKIINGELAVEGQFPYMVQLAIRRKETTKYCGGSLIDSQWVLTAAHCLKEMESAQAYLGSVFMRTMPVKLRVVDASVHPLYKNINAYDIALVKLEMPLNFTDRVKPVNLPTRHQTTTERFMNSTLSVAGFGQTKNASQSNLFLRFVIMRGISSEECSDEWGWKMRETLVCAQGFNSLKETTCSGDSGNGLVVQESNDPVVYGIVSYGAPGCLGKPKVFTKVASYIDFIHSVTGIEIKT